MFSRSVKRWPELPSHASRVDSDASCSIAEVATSVWPVARLIAPYASRVEGTSASRPKPTGIASGRTDPSTIPQPHGRDYAYVLHPLCRSAAHAGTTAPAQVFPPRPISMRKNKFDRIERQDYFREHSETLNGTGKRRNIVRHQHPAHEDYSAEPPSR